MGGMEEGMKKGRKEGRMEGKALCAASVHSMLSAPLLLVA